MPTPSGAVAGTPVHSVHRAAARPSGTETSTRWGDPSAVPTLTRNRRGRVRGTRTLAAAMLVVVGALASAPSALTATITTTFNGTVSTSGTKYRTHTISVVDPGTISLTLDWDDSSANLT